MGKGMRKGDEGSSLYTSVDDQYEQHPNEAFYNHLNAECDSNPRQQKRGGGHSEELVGPVLRAKALNSALCLPCKIVLASGEKKDHCAYPVKLSLLWERKRIIVTTL